jgi:hypothetical protein
MEGNGVFLATHDTTGEKSMLTCLFSGLADSKTLTNLRGPPAHQHHIL